MYWKPEFSNLFYKVNIYASSLFRDLIWQTTLIEIVGAGKEIAWHLWKDFLMWHRMLQRIHYTLVEGIIREFWGFTGMVEGEKIWGCQQ